MSDTQEKGAELLAEVEELRARVAELEKRAAARNRAPDLLSESGAHSFERANPQQPEDAFRRSGQQLLLLIDSLPLLISYVDANQCYRFNNKSYETWFGCSASEVYGRHIKEIMGAAAYEAVRGHVEAALAGRQVSFETYVPYEKGIHREVHGAYIPDIIDGKVEGFFALVRDISERRQNERILEKTLQSLAEAQRIAHLGNWDWDIERNELFWSDEIYRIFGLAPREFGATYEAFLASVHPDDRERVNRSVDAALRERRPYSIDHRIIRPDGGERIVHEQAAVIFNEQGRPSRMIGTVQDVTEAKRAESALEERLRFEQFLSKLSAGFISVPGERVAEEIERGLQEVVKFMGLDCGALMQCVNDAEKIVVSHYWAVTGVPPPAGLVIDQTLPWLADQVRGGALVAHERLPDDLPEEAQAEKQLCRKAGFKSGVSVPLKVGGLTLGAVAFGSSDAYHDLPDEIVQRLELIGNIFANALSRRRIEEHSRGLRAELSHVARVATLGELSASLAHELNQPLTAMLANAQAAQRYLSNQPPDLGEVRAILNDIVGDDKRAGEIIHKLRALLRKGEPKFELLDFNTIAVDVVALLRNDAALRGVKLDMQAAPDLPQVYGDRVQLQQVLMNLVLNASDAVAGEERPNLRTVVVRTEKHDGENIRVTVRDFGPGLPEDVEQLFEPFHSTKANGLGVGLSISRSIIAAHGGRVWAFNNADGGASFSFTTPTAAGAPHEK
jgi:PAS domain S-box-containing protein